MWRWADHYSKSIPSIERERAAFVFDEVIHKGKSLNNEMIKMYNEKKQKVYMTMSLSPIKDEDGEIAGLVGIMKNITDKHLAEKKAKEYSRILEIKVKEQLTQAQELKGLRDFNEDIINPRAHRNLRHGPVGNYSVGEPGSETDHGPQSQLIRLSGSIFSMNTDSPKANWGNCTKAAGTTRRPARAFDIPYRALTSGRDLIINATVVPILDSNDTIEKTIFMVEDHTEQATITNRVYEAEKLSALGILASGVASELKTCINKMVMDLNFVDNNLDEGSPATEYIDSLHHEVGRIKNITEQLVSLSTADEEDKEICDINKILSSHQVDVMLKRLRSEGFDVAVEPAQEPAPVQANQNQLQQLLIQFIENAEEAMPDKGSITHCGGNKAVGRGQICDTDHHRYRHRDPGREPPEDISAIFHHEGEAGDGTGPHDYFGNRPEPRRNHRLEEQARRGDILPDHPAHC